MSAAPELRDYQREAVGCLREAVRYGARRCYLSMPTGSGKTRVLAEVVAGVAGRGRRVLWIVHRKELVDQAAEVLATAAGAEVGVVMAARDEARAPVVVASVQSLSPARLAAVLAGAAPVGLCVIDECHHAVPSNSYGRIIAQLAANWPEALVIGATATPYRADRSRMADLLPVCAFERSIESMIRAGWLVPTRWRLATLDGLRLEQVRTRRSGGEIDYREDDLAKAVRGNAVIADLVAETAPLLEGRRSIVFAASVEHAQALARRYQRARLRCACVYGAMPPGERASVLERWRAGELDLVTNYGVLTEGYDLPELSAVVVARPTMSPGLYAQMVGRGLRRAPGKADCLVIDTTGRGVPQSGRPLNLGDLLGEAVEDEEGFFGFPEDRPRGRLLLDPTGRSRWAWARDAETGALVALVSPGILAAVVEGHDGSGLYASLVLKAGRMPERCVDRLLPMREAIGALEASLGRLGLLPLADRGHPWRAAEATEPQLRFLASIDPPAHERALAERWNRGVVSGALDCATARPVLRALRPGGALDRLVGDLRPFGTVERVKGYVA